MKETGPVVNYVVVKMIAPINKILLKFFFLSGIIPNGIAVRINVTPCKAYIMASQVGDTPA